MVETDRFIRWATAARVLDQVAPSELGGALARNAIFLGRWDVRLRHADREQTWTRPDPTWFVPGYPPADHGDHLALSRMWVLDAYELVRTVDGAVRAGAWTPTDPIPQEITSIKRAFAKIRIPLAKYELAGRSGRAVAGDAVPFPIFLPDRGAAWIVGGTDGLTTREELGELLLTVLEHAGSTT